MSIRQLICLDAYCDNCKRSFGEAEDEPANAPGVGSWTSSPRKARADMKTFGWKAVRQRGRLVDLCPKCVEDQG